MTSRNFHITTESPVSYKVTGFKISFITEKVYSHVVVTDELVMGKHLIHKIVNKHYSLEKAEKALAKFQKANPGKFAVIAEVAIYTDINQD